VCSQDANDSIVAVRVRRKHGDSFTSVSGERTMRLHGTVLKKVPTAQRAARTHGTRMLTWQCDDTWQVPTVRPILDHSWFLDQIESCERRCDALFGGRGQPPATNGESAAQIMGLE